MYLAPLLRPKNITQLDKVNHLGTLKDLVKKYGMAVTIIAREGETYEVEPGYPQVTPAGFVYLEILNSANKNLFQFWSEYQRLTRFD